MKNDISCKNLYKIKEWYNLCKNLYQKEKRIVTKILKKKNDIHLNSPSSFLDLGRPKIALINWLWFKLFTWEWTLTSKRVQSLHVGGLNSRVHVMDDWN